ncbi:hypothetical protein FSP39_022063 [Pinctada imbricata]|uniref:Exonuclease 1 n=1 Tax=Pinctada imbricata TaxID=66713 RepID=A0AA88XXQ5_PINIB|nr:hypothetical protein FSP39_022063 [Pinctada imbricata]
MKVIDIPVEEKYNVGSDRALSPRDPRSDINLVRMGSLKDDSLGLMMEKVLYPVESINTNAIETKYVYYCMKYIDNMLKKNIKPILVFDGCHLPSKREVEKSRREKREVNRKKAAQLLREGKRAEARECLQRCIDISPEMALNLMNTCRARGVDCIVAPYEADAQLAFLNKAGIAQIIITEDSDLLLFGCEKVIFKMDHMGNGLLIEQRRLNEVLEINGAGFTFDKFRYMCILSGCDYLASLPGIGLAKACKVFKMARQDDLKLLLKKFPSTYLKMNLTVTEEYIQGFLQANNTFLHQLVYDPINRELRPLCRYPPGVDSEDFPYAGAISMMSKEHALQVALGNINIYNGEKFAAFDPDQPTNKKSNSKKSPHLHLLSIWDRNYHVRPKGELKETQNIQRPNLKGKEVVVQHNALNWKKKEIVDPDTIKSNHELSTMYEEFPDEKPQVESLTDVSIKQISPNTSPRRISPRNSPRRKKRRSSESDDDVKLSPVKKYRKLSQSPQKFLKSLVAANTNSPVKTGMERHSRFPYTCLND